MSKIQGIRTKKNFLYHCLLLIILIAVFFVLGKAVWLIYKKNQLAKNNLKFSIERLNDLEQREKTLQDKITKLKTDRGIENEIRVSFPVVKPGEKIINIIEEPEVTSTISTSSEKSWWQLLFDF